MYISKDILKECKPIYANSTFLLIQDLCTGQEFGFVTGPRGGQPSSIGLTPGRDKSAQNGSGVSQTSFLWVAGSLSTKENYFFFVRV
jgi:hypothetical protein